MKQRPLIATYLKLKMKNFAMDWWESLHLGCLQLYFGFKLWDLQIFYLGIYDLEIWDLDMFKIRNLEMWDREIWDLEIFKIRNIEILKFEILKSEIVKSKILKSEFLRSLRSQTTLINQNKVGIYMFVTSCDEHGDGCLHTCYYYRANGQEVCLSEKCSDNFLYVGLFSDFIAH